MSEENNERREKILEGYDDCLNRFENIWKRKKITENVLGSISRGMSKKISDDEFYIKQEFYKTTEEKCLFEEAMAYESIEPRNGDKGGKSDAGKSISMKEDIRNGIMAVMKSMDNVYSLASVAMEELKDELYYEHGIDPYCDDDTEYDDWRKEALRKIMLNCVNQAYELLHELYGLEEVK